VSNLSNNISLTKIYNCIAQFILARNRPARVKYHATVMANQDQQVRPQPSEANQIHVLHITLVEFTVRNCKTGHGTHQQTKTLEPKNQ